MQVLWVAVADWRNTTLSRKNPRAWPHVREPGWNSLHEIPVLLSTSTKDHDYEGVSSSARVRLEQFATCLSPAPFDHDKAAQQPEKCFPPNRACSDPFVRHPNTVVLSQPRGCHNRGAVRGASYAGTASERKRFVITCEKESALSNLRALVAYACSSVSG